MYCPKCRNEYRDGFTLCNDCNTALIAELPDAEQQIKTDPDEQMLLASELDLVRIAIAKGVLDLANIPYSVQDLVVMSAGPNAWRPSTFQLYVARKDSERATAELREGFKELMGTETSYADEQ
jgi:hypothetical protein